MFGDFVKMTLDSILESFTVTRVESFGKKAVLEWNHQNIVSQHDSSH